MNIYDIANMAGVSIATVSRVINGSDKVTDKTRQKVMHVIEDVGYTPNIFAQGMIAGSIRTVGILVPSLSDLSSNNAVYNIENNLNNLGYTCILSCCGLNLNAKKIHMDMLLSRHIDALILIGSTFSENDRINEAGYIIEASKKVPVFLVNAYVHGDNIHSFVCDDFRAIFDNTIALIESGYDRPVFITDSETYSAEQKMKGFLAACNKKELDPSAFKVIHTKNGIKSVILNLKKLSFDFNAAVCADDILAVGAVQYANSVNKKIPDDISVIGYSNSQLTSVCEPELTSIDNKIERVCRDLVDMLIKTLASPSEITGNKIVIPCTLVERKTTSFRKSQI